MKPLLSVICLFCLLLFLCGCQSVNAQRIYGTLENDPARTEKQVKQGITAVVLVSNWDRFEPEKGKINETFVQELLQKMQVFRQAGAIVCLDLGMQYPPKWLFEVPHSRYVNQYGKAYIDPSPGMNIPNEIFNQQIRDAQQQHLENVFKKLGNNFYGVRLGWGQYGELCYPKTVFAGKNNCFWAYDDIAQGKAKGLSKGLTPCPVPGWKIGAQSKDHESARRFADWYIDSLVKYQNWQIDTVRKNYSGLLMVMYPSWGLRPGILEDLIKKNLNSKTFEIQRGLDYERLVNATNDPKVIVYSTWMDGDNQYVKDDQPNPRDWSPIHYLSYLAQQHPLKLQTWGENTGRGDAGVMKLCFERMEKFHMQGMIWAFEKELYDQTGKFAQLDLYISLIKENQKN